MVTPYLFHRSRRGGLSHRIPELSDDALRHNEYIIPFEIQKINRFVAGDPSRGRILLTTSDAVSPRETGLED